MPCVLFARLLLVAFIIIKQDRVTWLAVVEGKTRSVMAHKSDPCLLTRHQYFVVRFQQASSVN